MVQPFGSGRMREAASSVMLRMNATTRFNSLAGGLITMIFRLFAADHNFLLYLLLRRNVCDSRSQVFQDGTQRDVQERGVARPSHDDYLQLRGVFKRRKERLQGARPTVRTFYGRMADGHP